MSKVVAVMGIRGIPAAHGGFETFAERLALFLVDEGWEVVVYCDDSRLGATIVDHWRGVRRVRIPSVNIGPLSSIVFDIRCVIHSLRSGTPVWLVLGYGTGFLAIVSRVFGRAQITNMDGLEWAREKWGRVAKAWLWINEFFAARFSTLLIADHPRIADYLRRKFPSSPIRMIPYGGDDVRDGKAVNVQLPGGLTQDGFYLVIARPEPENSIMEIVKAFCRFKRDRKLVVLGEYGKGASRYAQEVAGFASEDVIFLGPIYDKEVVMRLRRDCFAYIHGHRVGGTNPSLVESLGAGSAILAHDNEFNRWVAGDSALYFLNSDDCALLFARLDEEPELVEALRSKALNRFDSGFHWAGILRSYKEVLEEFVSAP